MIRFMNSLFLLGGPPRTAKTTIMSALVAERKVQFIPADAVEHGLRNVLTGEPHQMLRHIELSGQAEYKTTITEGGEMKPFSNQGTESELTLQTIIGMIDYYVRNNTSIAFEGAAFTPTWVSNLKIANLAVRAAFVGYTQPSHADSVIAYAKDHPDDWINDWLENEGGNETKIREWIAKQTDKCLSLKVEAEEHGYPFFDISTQPFEEYIASVQHYFLTDRDK
jgi:hypothetical protein